MIDIKTISGELLLSVPILEDAVIHEELMASDYVALSWSSESDAEIPAGAYIEYEGERYSLLEPYRPERADEVEYRYKPQLHSRVMAWDKQPACVYTYEDDGKTIKSREFDWSFVGSPADAMYIVLQAIKNETGEEWSLALSDSLPSSIEITGQASSILAVLSDIANQCETEYWVDRKSNILHLSKCEHGDPVALTVGDNVGVPSVTSNREGYFTRYYALGSTRNITQASANINGSVNKRLTLNPDVYPMGYKDIKGHYENGVFVSDLQQGEIFSSVLIFDDIYPSSDLVIYDVRPRMKYNLDGGGNKVVIGGTEDAPVYDQYAVWYFKIRDFEFTEDLIIPNKKPSVHFKSGQLTGQEFELTYHAKASSVKDSGDVVRFEIEAGDYEILFKNEGDVILPSVAYLIPQDDNKVTLFNIEMPSEYTQSAMGKLEEALDNYMAKASADSNSYEVSSNPVAFYEAETSVGVGRKVTFVNGGSRIETRVLMVEKRLDYPCQQKIRVGNNLIKGSTKELRENVESLNKDVDVIAAFNDLSKSIQDSYGRAQALTTEFLLKFDDMFYFADDNTIGTRYNFFSEKENSAGGMGEAIGTSGGGGDVDLTGYATEAWVESQGYAKTTDIPSKVSALENDAEYVTKSQADGTYVIWTDEFVPLKEKVDGIDERVTVLEATGGNGSGDIDPTAYATKTWVAEQVGGKQDTIEDLAAIREGASKGATAAQPSDIPTKVSQLTNDRNYITTTAADGKYAAYSDLEKYLKSTDIADWAKAATKPSYDYSEIGNTPDLTIYALASALSDYALKNDVYTQQQIADILKSYVLTNDIAELVEWYESIGVKFIKDADGAIKMDGDFYTTGENSAGGVGENVGTSGGGGLDESQLEDYLTENGYATQSWVTSQGYASSSSVDAKQDNITDLAAIRAGAALGATALQGVPDEYVTETELDQKGYATTADLSGKVDKVTGKGLSTNDYTTEDKNKLASLENYDDTEVKNDIAANAEAITEVSNRVIPLEEWYDLVGQHFKYDETNEAWYLDGDFYATGENSAGGAGDELIDIAGLDTRVETLETKLEELQKTSSQNLAIDFQGLDSLIQLSGSITSAELATVGLTAAAIENMLNGQYNKIVHSGAKRQVWNYTAYEGDGTISIHLMQGDGFDIFNGYSLSYSSTTGYWSIVFGEI